MTDPDASTAGPVTWHLAERVFTVRLNQPPANALGAPILDGLRAALDDFDAAPARVLVLSSALPGFFAAGADIKLMAGADIETFTAYGRDMREQLDRISGHARPSIAAIEGRALGGGLELALTTTLRVGSDSAVLGLPEPRLGLIPGVGGTQRLPRLLGRGRALEIMLSAREVGGAEAHAIGLLDRLVPAGQAEAGALALAAEMCALSGAALTQIMRSVDDAYALDPADGLKREAARVTELFQGAEAKEGLRAFLERRRPDYS